MKEAGLDFPQLSGVAATAGPGLIGGVLVGSPPPRRSRRSTSCPCSPSTTLKAMRFRARLTEPVAFPYLLLLVSGGHCQLLRVEGPGRYRRYGTTIDDAAGEAFDKTAKLLGLGFPGGPAIEQAAATGNAKRLRFPAATQRPGRRRLLLRRASRPQSRKRVEALGRAPSDEERANIAASFQAAVIDVLAEPHRAALQMFRG